MKIMIVDDHSGMREIMRILLSARGIELIECADGREALATYQESQPDWVFMDSMMKHLDGLSATRELVGRYPHARVLMVSGEDIEQLRRAARTAGASGFVSKDNLLSALTQNPALAAAQLESLWVNSARA